MVGGGRGVLVGAAGWVARTPSDWAGGAPTLVWGLQEARPSARIVNKRNAMRCIENDFNRRFLILLNATAISTLPLVFYLPTLGYFLSEERCSRSVKL